MRGSTLVGPVAWQHSQWLIFLRFRCLFRSQRSRKKEIWSRLCCHVLFVVWYSVTKGCHGNAVSTITLSQERVDRPAAGWFCWRREQSEKWPKKRTTPWPTWCPRWLTVIWLAYSDWWKAATLKWTTSTPVEWLCFNTPPSKENWRLASFCSTW